MAARRIRRARLAADMGRIVAQYRGEWLREACPEIRPHIACAACMPAQASRERLFRQGLV
ncbi:hypothetical protein GCM10027046_33690 [Uliginosibacterium flavum]